jgi:hypothetical protein
MSHNPAFVLITNVPEQSYELLLQKLKLNMYIRSQNNDSENPEGTVNLLNVTYDFFTDKLWIGHYGQVLILVNGLLAHEFLRTDSSATEEAFVKAFPWSDIVSLSYGSGSTSYSYVVIRNGEKLRVKNGSQDGSIIDFGEPLPMEHELGINDIIDPYDLEELRAERSPDEVKTVLDGMRGSTVMHKLVPYYLGGLQLYHEGLKAIPVSEFVKC